MKKIKNLKELRIWMKSKDLVVEIYKLTATFPTSEKFGLTSQLRRAAISVMANIAEGFYRQTTKELISFLINARGSAGEVISHLIISTELDYIGKKKSSQLIERYEQLIVSISSLIKSLRKKLKR
ncbi:four helix bundle protein [Patescibacteria group bacterium]|nr:four helix bundle protein [Patescibacteria group bacterium]